MDWTKVLGSGVLIAGVIVGSIFGDVPKEVLMAWGSLVPALWVAKPLAKTVGIKAWDK